MVSTERIDRSLDQLLAGSLSEYIACHGRSQYNVGQSGQGLSACGIAAVNCARVIFDKERSGLSGLTLARDIARSETAEEVLAICASWSSAAHVDVEDIYTSPVFSRSLRLVTHEYGQPSSNLFTTLLRSLKTTSHNNRCVSCAIITRPPEIIACFYIPCPSKADIYVVFDSHPRPDHPHGAAFMFRTSLTSMSAYLEHLLPFDRSLIWDDTNQWQAQLLGNLSCHVFVAKPCSTDPRYWRDATLQASVELLNLRAEYLDLKARTTSLNNMNNDLRERLAREALAHSTTDREASKSPRLNIAGSSTSYKQSSSDAKGKGAVRASPQERTSAPTVTPVQPEIAMPGNYPITPHSSHPSSATDSEVYYDSSQFFGSDPIPEDNGVDADFAFALEQQRIFDEEDRRLTAELGRLNSRAPKAFRCGVCFDDYTEEDVAVVDGCHHRFCRDCMRQYASSKVKEHRYPIICPVCQTSTSKTEAKRKPSILDSVFIQQLGLSEDQFATYIELEMSSFSILLHCRSCQNSFFVDKRDLDGTAIISCPLPRCQYSWCRTCNQPVQSEDTHSCDGSAELKRLMTLHGWKYCPGCQTPAEKIDGCNHLLCTAPGCNTHFCYLCSQAIVRSIDGEMIRAELERHYSRCRLFQEFAEPVVDA